MATEAPETNPIVSQEVLRDPAIPGTSPEEAGTASFGARPLSVLAALWACDMPLTIGRLAAATGMCRPDVEEAVRQLRALKLLRTLNTVIESYQPCGTLERGPGEWFPGARPAEASSLG